VAGLEERELGKTMQELVQVRHDFRNLRQVVSGLLESQAQLTLENARLQQRINTTIRIGGGLFAVAGFLLHYLR